ncbi:hypothetical protein ANCCEY_02422 [Ancylostoma ceylanicum]|uniref:C2 domain-containing protein n=1 Tax=Ancylostoma ceylanicum TaxID=53326 RepID=A0A0D6MC83_9BILA|nr:hypothetical protein ANCCEY_02422 [Ancylostoma ceylanicum]
MACYCRPEQAVHCAGRVAVEGSANSYVDPERDDGGADVSSQKWAKADEIRAKKASIAQHGERAKEKINLVPDHVETRSLYTEMTGNTPCGELRMFVDLFPLSYGGVPPPIDIGRREPEKYQLRVALFNVTGAIPVKRSFGVPTSDLYVKVFVNGSERQQKSDVHFR